MVSLTANRPNHLPAGIAGRLLVCLIALFCLAAPQALAQGGNGPQSILPEEPATPEPPPDDGVFTIAVFGDSLAHGIWGSLFRTLQRDDRFEVLNNTLHSTGIARPDYYDWQVELEAFIAEDPIDAAVFSIGLNDMQGMYVPGESSLRFRSDAWDTMYQERVGRLIETLQEAEIPTYWVGLPIMRSGNYSENIAHLNTFFDRLTDDYGIDYISTWELTVDENGEFSSYLPDETGRTRLMRANDGIHFTPRGYDIIGDAVLDRMAEDLAIFQEVAGE